MEYDLKRVRELLGRLFDTPTTIEEVEERADLVVALGRLLSRDQGALILRAQGYRYAEIARRLDVRRAEYIVKRAEVRLARELEEPCR